MEGNRTGIVDLASVNGFIAVAVASYVVLVVLAFVFGRNSKECVDFDSNKKKN